MLIDSRRIKGGSDTSRVELSWPAFGQGEGERFLSIDGEPAYYVGFSYQTCEFLFTRLGGAHASIELDYPVELLESGIDQVDGPIIERILDGLPPDTYHVLLLEVTPSLVGLGSERDYFASEQIGLWGVSGFWRLPHHPKVEYFRTPDLAVDKHAALYQFLVPMYPHGWISDEPATAEYESRILEGAKPTALALSVLDWKQPAVWEGDPVVNEHFCLAHYLLDGHHKVVAAARTGSPITLLAFLSEGASLATGSELKCAINALRRAAV